MAPQDGCLEVSTPDLIKMAGVWPGGWRRRAVLIHEWSEVVTVRKVCQDVNPCVPANVHHSDSWEEPGERCS